MKLLRPALYAFMLWPSLATTGFAAEDAGSAMAEPCDMICQMKTYFDTDHMVRLVPAPDRDRSARTQATPRPRTRLAAAPIPSRHRRVEAATIVAGPLRRSAKPAPSRVAQLIPTLATVPLQSPPLVQPGPQIIPGAAPLVMSRFASPAADAPR